MARRALVPSELRQRPFTVEQARRAGLERWHLERTTWRHLGAGVYAWTGLPQTPWVILAGIQLRLPDFACFSGRTAGWTLGYETPPLEPAQVTVPDKCGITATRLVSVRRARIDPRDITLVRGLRVTAPARTLCDLSPRVPLVDAVVAIETALRLRQVTLPELLRWSVDRAGTKGIKAFRRALAQTVPGAESPMETRLRMLLVEAGLPPPAVQADLRDGAGHPIARADLYYPSHRLVIEYDGSTHRDSVVEDNRRQNSLLAAGYRLLRFTASDVLGMPKVVVAQVREQLGASRAA